MAKSAKRLAKEYEVSDFFNYIIESYINGNKTQCVELFKEMNRHDQLLFIHDIQHRFESISQYIISKI